MNEFAIRLRHLREKRQISRRALSELVGLSKNMIAVYERGEVEPPASVVILLAQHFEVSTDYLLGNEKNF